jgi:parallel beta-helix repeat protein
MNKRFVLTFIVSMFIVSLATALEVQQAKADATVYIRADGSVDPPSASIQRVGDVYALIGNVNGSLVIERSNIVFDGKGFTVDGLGGGVGVNVTDRNNVTVSGVHVRGCDYGIWFYSTSNSSILNNTVTECVWMAITIYYSTGVLLSDNNVTDNTSGIWVKASSFNTVSNNTVVGSQSYGASGLYIDHDSCDNLFFGNTMESNYYDVYLAPYSHNNTLLGNSINDGVEINNSPDNLFLHNNFITIFQISSTGYPSNMWDNGLEGNYWRLYNGTDSNQDGIGDIPYILGPNNTDNYPLMGMFYSINITFLPGSTVTLISNSTISFFSVVTLIEYAEPEPSNGIPTVLINFTDQTGFGFCRVSIPHALMNISDTPVTIDQGSTPALTPNYMLYDNGTQRWIYFAYEQSPPLINQTSRLPRIMIIPESQSFLILPLFMIATLLAVIVYRRCKVN